MPRRGLCHLAPPPGASSCCLLFRVRLRILCTCTFPGPAGGFTVSGSVDGVGEGFLPFLPQRQCVLLGIEDWGQVVEAGSLTALLVTSFWLFLQEQEAFPLYSRSVCSTGGFQACWLVASDLPLKHAGPWPWLDSPGSPAPLSTWADLVYLHHWLSPRFCFAPSPPPGHLWSWGNWATVGVDSPWVLGSCGFKTIMCADTQPLRNCQNF